MVIIRPHDEGFYGRVSHSLCHRSRRTPRQYDFALTMCNFFERCFYEFFTQLRSEAEINVRPRDVRF